MGSAGSVGCPGHVGCMERPRYTECLGCVGCRGFWGALGCPGCLGWQGRPVGQGVCGIHVTHGVRGVLGCTRVLGGSAGAHPRSAPHLPQNPRGGSEGPPGPAAAGLSSPAGRDRVRAAVPDGGPRLSPPACPPAALGRRARPIPAARELWGCWAGTPGSPARGGVVPSLDLGALGHPAFPALLEVGLEVPLPPCAKPGCFPRSGKSSKPGKPPPNPAKRPVPPRHGGTRGVPATGTGDQPGTGTPPGPQNQHGRGSTAAAALILHLPRPWGVRSRSPR